MILNGLGILIIGASHLAYPGSLVSSLNNGLIDKGAHTHSFGVCGVSPSQWTLEKRGACGAAERINKGPVQLKMGSKAVTVPIQQLIEAEKPALLVVVMGDTLADYRNKDGMSLRWAASEVDALTQKISASGVKCVWVGPTWGEEGKSSQKTYARVKQLDKLLSDRVSPCSYISSLKMSKPGEWPTVDGLHYNEEYYNQWGPKIIEELGRVE
ncbi:MAG: SGNH/GDSL hydrolase family protein [Nitrosomonadales bacterium]|jgi:hypothetical protein